VSGLSPREAANHRTRLPDRPKLKACAVGRDNEKFGGVKDDSEVPKLQMAPRENPEDLIRRIEREQRAAGLQRERELESSLAPFRVGSVPYLNSVPLTRGLEDEIQLVPPAKLAEMMARDELDAGLLSITEVLFNDRYDVLNGIAIASLGEVFSVFLAHRQPLEKIQRIHCTPASRTSIWLLRVLLAERGLKPDLSELSRKPHEEENVLLIGNPAIEFRRSEYEHQIWDLGAAWFEMARLPFVYAVWALQRKPGMERLRQQLREAKDFGIDTLDYLIENRTEYDREFRKDYLGWHIHYHLGADEKRGISRFAELLGKYSGQSIFEPRYIS
jgi:chorismate dehydratase